MFCCDQNQPLEAYATSCGGQPVPEGVVPFHLSRRDGKLICPRREMRTKNLESGCALGGSSNHAFGVQIPSSKGVVKAAKLDSHIVDFRRRQQDMRSGETDALRSTTSAAKSWFEKKPLKSCSRVTAYALSMPSSKGYLNPNFGVN